MRRSVITMKLAERLVQIHNLHHQDTLSLSAAYGNYKVIRRVEGGGWRDAGKVGKSGYMATPRLALDAAGVSLVNYDALGRTASMEVR